nr:integrase, catalytic region, zinc finger, CCHC-type, peptidase aspartic, catalytic [Tanacetum cinerariifolium]
MTNNINHFRELVDQALEKHSHNHFCASTALDMEVLIKTCLMPLAKKTQNDSFTFVHELKQEIHADLKYAESLENEIDELESDKAEFSNMYDMLLQECVSNDVIELVDQALEKHSHSHFCASTALDMEVLIKTCLMPLAKKIQNDSFTFVHELKQEIHADLKYAESLKNEIDELESDKAEFSNMYDMLLQEVIHKTNVSRPQLRSNQMKDKVMLNNSQVKDKKTKVEDHPRISSISNKTKSVTACNDSLKSRTSNIAQLILFIVDSGCTKHMPGNLTLLYNIVKKYLGTVRFGNFAQVLGYGDLVQGNIMINMVYYVKGFNHNLFSIGQFCDADLEVAFWKSTYFVRDL